MPRRAGAAEIVEVIERCCNLQGLLVSPSVARLVGSVGTLPSLPRGYAELIEKLADPEAGLHDDIDPTYLEALRLGDRIPAWRAMAAEQAATGA